MKKVSVYIVYAFSNHFTRNTKITRREAMVIVGRSMNMTLNDTPDSCNKCFVCGSVKISNSLKCVIHCLLYPKEALKKLNRKQTFFNNHS